MSGKAKKCLTGKECHVVVVVAASDETHFTVSSTGRWKLAVKKIGILSRMERETIVWEARARGKNPKMFNNKSRHEFGAPRQRRRKWDVFLYGPKTKLVADDDANMVKMSHF